MQINVEFNSKVQAAIISAVAISVAYICAVTFDVNRVNILLNVFQVILGGLALITGVVCGEYAIIHHIDDVERKERNGK